MKKTITINLSNRVFQIEEEAYSMLDQYLHGLRTYFKHSDPDGEITDDIEARISELFAEKKRLGHEVITTEITSEVIHRVGEMRDLVDSDEEGENNSTSASTAETGSEDNSKGTTRKFYRDNTRKWVAGVLAGLAAYTDISVWMVRLFFIFLLFSPLTVFAIVMYIACAIFIPAAVTVNQRLEMQGEPVSPDAIWKKISEESKDLGSKLSSGLDRVREKYNLHDTPPQAASTTTPAPKKNSWVSWVTGLLVVVLAVGLSFGCLYLLAPNLVHDFHSGFYDGFHDDWDFEWSGLPFALNSLGIAAAIIIPLVILLCIAVVLFCLAILIVPIGIILKAPIHTVAKVFLIIGWFFIFYYFIA